MSTVKECDRVRILAREATDEDSKSGMYYGNYAGMTGTVQKVSNLIINMNIYLHDVQTGKPIAAMSADMRGNTDESWTRTMDWLIRNRVLAPNYGAPQAQ